MSLILFFEHTNSDRTSSCINLPDPWKIRNAQNYGFFALEISRALPPASPLSAPNSLPLQPGYVSSTQFASPGPMNPNLLFGQLPSPRRPISDTVIPLTRLPISRIPLRDPRPNSIGVTPSGARYPDNGLRGAQRQVPGPFGRKRGMQYRDHKREMAVPRLVVGNSKAKSPVATKKKTVTGTSKLAVAAIYQAQDISKPKNLPSPSRPNASIRNPKSHTVLKPQVPNVAFAGSPKLNPVAEPSDSNARTKASADTKTPFAFTWPVTGPNDSWFQAEDDDPDAAARHKAQALQSPVQLIRPKASPLAALVVATPARATTINKN